MIHYVQTTVKSGSINLYKSSNHDPIINNLVIKNKLPDYQINTKISTLNSYIYIYIYNVYTHTHIHVYMQHTLTHTQTHTRVHTHTHTHTHHTHTTHTHTQHTHAYYQISASLRSEHTTGCSRLCSRLSQPACSESC